MSPATLLLLGHVYHPGAASAPLASQCFEVPEEQEVLPVRSRDRKHVP